MKNYILILSILILIAAGCGSGRDNGNSVNETLKDSKMSSKVVYAITSNTIKAKVFLGTGGDIFTVSTTGTTVYGGVGNDTVTIAPQVTDVILDQNIEQVVFYNPLSSYTFKQTGNLINVYDTTGSTLIVKAPVQGGSNGTVLAFNNGTATASAKLANGVMTLGTQTVSSGDATLPNVATTPGTTLSITISTSKAKVYLGADDNFTVSNSGITLYGNTGNNEITITGGVTGVILDQNIERINFAGALGNYAFKQTGNIVNVYPAGGDLIVVKVPVQGDSDGTILAFNNGNYSVQLAGGIMTLGGVAISTGTQSVLTATPITTTTTTTTVPPTTTTTTLPPVVVPTTYSLSVTSKPTTTGHGGSYYATPVVVKVVNQNNVAVANVTPVVTFNDNGWVMNPTAATTTTGTVSYYWAPGSSTTPSMTVTYGGSSTTITGLVTPWPSNPNANASSVWNNSPPATGYSKQVSPLTDPTGTYYAAMGWTGGYTGMQRGGYMGSIRYDRNLIFSLWDQSGAAKVSVIDQGTSTCKPFDWEGNGIYCVSSYPWVVGANYQFTMTSVAGVGYKDISVNFTDMATNQTMFLGTMRQPNAPESWTSFYSFVEDFIVNDPTCFTIADRSAIFSNARYLVGSTWYNVTGTTTVSRWDPTQYCAQSSYSAVSGGGVGAVQINVGKSFRTPTLALFNTL